MTLDELRAEATMQEGEHRAWDSMAVELEVAELLYALVRQIKPAMVVECGAGNGYATRFIAEALQANHEQSGVARGLLVTFEQDPDYFDTVWREFGSGNLPVAVAFGIASEGRLFEKPDLVFIDTLGEYRPADMVYWLSHPAQPLVAIHDADGYPSETFPATGVMLSAGRGLWLGRG